MKKNCVKYSHFNNELQFPKGRKILNILNSVINNQFLSARRQISIYMQCSIKANIKPKDKASALEKFLAMLKNPVKKKEKEKKKTFYEL